MRKIIVVVFFIAVAAVWCCAQEMPKEVKRFLDNYTRNLDAPFGPLHAKGAGRFNDSVQIKDLKIRTIEVYRLKHVFLDEYPDTVALSEIMEPSGYWFVLVMAHNKPLYQLTLDNTQGEPVVYKMSYLHPDSKSRKMWEQLLKAYPKSSGINPVVFSQYGPTVSKGSFLYFKQKGPRKIYYIRTVYKHDPLEELFPGSIETLDDSKKLIKYWKEQGLNELGVGIDKTRTP